MKLGFLKFCLVFFCLLLFVPFVFAQQVSFTLVEHISFKELSRDGSGNILFESGPQSFSGGVPVFSSNPRPRLDLVVREVNTSLSADLASLSNSEFSDLVIGRGYFHYLFESSDAIVSENFEHVALGDFRSRFSWVNSSFKEYFLVVESGHEFLFEELSRRLEFDDDFRDSFFNLPYSFRESGIYQTSKSKGSEILRRKFWEFHGVYDYDLRCSILGHPQYPTFKFFVDYYFCVNSNTKGVLERSVTRNYVDWRNSLINNENFKNDIRLSYYNSLLNGELIKRRPGVVSFTNQIDGVDNFCERLVLADNLGDDAASYALSISEIESVLGLDLYEDYESLRVSVFNRHVSFAGCEGVSLAGRFESSESVAGRTLYGIRNYAFSPNLNVNDLVIRTGDGLVIARASVSAGNYNPSLSDPFSFVFSPLMKLNYPSEYNHSFSVFSDARVKSLNGSFITIQDRWLDPSVFELESVWSSKPSKDVRLVSFNLGILSNSGLSIRSGHGLNPSKTGCVIVFGKEFCDGFIDIVSASSVGFLGEDRLVLNFDSASVNSVVISSSDIDANSWSSNFVYNFSGSPDNPLYVSYFGEEFVVTGNTVFDVRAVTSSAGMSDVNVNNFYLLEEARFKVNSGSFAFLDDGRPLYVFGEGSSFRAFSPLKNNAASSLYRNEWVRGSSSNSFILDTGSVNLFLEGGVPTTIRSSDSVFFRDVSFSDESLKSFFGANAWRNSGLGDLSVSSSDLLFPELVYGRNDLSYLFGTNDFLRDDLGVNLFEFSAGDSNIRSYLSSDFYGSVLFSENVRGDVFGSPINSVLGINLEGDFVHIFDGEFKTPLSIASSPFRLEKNFAPFDGFFSANLKENYIIARDSSGSLFYLFFEDFDPLAKLDFVSR